MRPLLLGNNSHVKQETPTRRDNFSHHTSVLDDVATLGSKIQDERTTSTCAFFFTHVACLAGIRTISATAEKAASPAAMRKLFVGPQARIM